MAPGIFGPASMDGRSAAELAPRLPRYPRRLARDAFYGVFYPLAYLSRRLEERLLELFEKGYVKGTVTISIGNEATALGMTMPLRPGWDFVSILHRDFGGHLVLGAAPYRVVCQFMANAHSPTHGMEGNVHHGDAAQRRFPMMSHLGKMLSPVVGATWAARRQGEDVFGLAAIGDGGSSTGEFHESLNMAAVHRVPVLFVVENNHYSFSTPSSAQYRCRHLSDRAAGFGIEGRTIDGTDPWEVYSHVCDMLDGMADDGMPRLLECESIRLHGHAAYDKGKYVPEALMDQWRQRDPVPAVRNLLRDELGWTEGELAALEEAIDSELPPMIAAAVKVARPQHAVRGIKVFAPTPRVELDRFEAKRATCGEAVHSALDYLLERNPTAFLAGMDVGTYGSAFKTCKGLLERFGQERVIDMPVCEPAIVGFALGASQTGAVPIIEFQFADFSTEAVTQLGMNAGTWHFRSGMPAPLLMRLPCGGGLTMGAFHSGEFEGLWSRFPGLKLLYPATPQETFEALVAGFYDPNPCLVFEHKLLYWSRRGDIEFDGDPARVWRPRRYTEGTDATIVAFGAMVHEALAAVAHSGRSVEVWNPFVLQPLDIGPIVESVRKTGRLLVVQESGATQGFGDRIISLVAREALGALKCPPRLLSSPDAPVPFAPELEAGYRPNASRVFSELEALLLA